MGAVLPSSWGGLDASWFGFTGPVFSLMRSQFRKQLYARGIARHDPEIITRTGRADLNALSAFLGERPFLLTDRPTSTDTAVFGLLAPTV